MTAWIVTLDPSAVIAGRTELNLNSGLIAVSNAGLDWGDAAVQQYLAEQRYGQTPVSYRLPNRTVTIPLGLGMAEGHSEAEVEAVRRQLQEKVALIQREQGVLKRQRQGGEPMYADIVDAKLTLPDVFGERGGGVEPNVSLVLECLPDFYGEEIELDAIEQTGQAISILKQSGSTAAIKGDYPARTRIVLTEKSANNQRGILWGVRSSTYSSWATSALFFDAYTLTPINGAVTGTEAGTFSGKKIELAVPAVNLWHPFLELTSTTIATGGEITTKHMQHLGSYRVFVRAKMSLGDKLRLVWSADDATTATENAAMTCTLAGEQIYDLGEIRLEEPPIGEHWWGGVLQVNTGPVASPVAVDRIWLQPLDDGAGRLRATGVPASTLLVPSMAPTEGANTSGSGTAWTNPSGAVKTGEKAYANLASRATSQVLALKKPGFAIPTGATVLGIQISLSGFGFVAIEPAEVTLQLYKAGVLAGTAITVSGNHSFPEVGGSANLWGTTWTPAQINESGFGVGVTFFNIGPFFGEAQVVDPVTIRVYYSTAATAGSQDAIIYSSRASQVVTSGAYRQDTATNAYSRVSEETGDLARIPPSGLEGRPCELFLKNSRGLLPTPGGNEAGELDAGVDLLKVQVFYRPCYVGRI